MVKFTLGDVVATWTSEELASLTSNYKDMESYDPAITKYNPTPGDLNSFISKKKARDWDDWRLSRAAKQLPLL